MKVKLLDFWSPQKPKLFIPIEEQELLGHGEEQELLSPGEAIAGLEQELKQIISSHEALSQINHIDSYESYQGDVRELEKYLTMSQQLRQSLNRVQERIAKEEPGNLQLEALGDGLQSELGSLLYLMQERINQVHESLVYFEPAALIAEMNNVRLRLSSLGQAPVGLLLEEDQPERLIKEGVIKLREHVDVCQKAHDLLAGVKVGMRYSLGNETQANVDNGLLIATEAAQNDLTLVLMTIRSQYKEILSGQGGAFVEAERGLIQEDAKRVELMCNGFERDKELLSNMMRARNIGQAAEAFHNSEPGVAIVFGHRFSSGQQTHDYSAIVLDDENRITGVAAAEYSDPEQPIVAVDFDMQEIDRDRDARPAITLPPKGKPVSDAQDAQVISEVKAMIRLKGRKALKAAVADVPVGLVVSFLPTQEQDLAIKQAANVDG